MSEESPQEAAPSSGAVFLSYASQDGVAAARICEALRAAGSAVWFDQSELRGGDAWDQKIRRQIRDCALFVPVISINTAARHEGYFRLEWDLADQRSRMMARDRTFIVPVCLDSTPAAGADMPESFHRVQWTRLPGGETPPAFCARIAHLLSPTLPSPAPPHPSAPPTARTLPRPPPRWRSRSMQLVSVAALLVLGYLAVDKARTLRAPQPPPTAAPVDSAGRATAHSAPGAPQKSIAVLPFLDMSEKHDQEYFSDGLTEELIDRLTHAPDLKVIARTSSFYFKGKQVTLAEIASTLGVSHVLEGSVRRSGNSLRISAQLIRASDGAPVWSRTFDRKLVDVFEVQKELAETVGQALEVAVAERGAGSRESSPAAYNLLLEADYVAQRASKADTLKAIALYKEALALGPRYAQAWTHLGEAYLSLLNFGMEGAESTDAAFEKASDALEHALRADPTLGDAYWLKGRIAEIRDWNWKEAAAAYARAGELDPSIDAGRLLAGIAQSFGHQQEAIDANERALARDPLSTNRLWNLGGALLMSGRYADAAAKFHRISELQPNYASAKALEAEAILLGGNREKALETVNLEPDEAWRISISPIVLWDLGRRNESDAALKELEEKYAASSAFNIAQMHAYRNEVDVAFRWLERGYRQRDPGMVGVKTDPLLRNLRSDPRFQAMLVKLKLDGPGPTVEN